MVCASFTLLGMNKLFASVIESTYILIRKVVRASYPQTQGGLFILQAE